MLAKIFSPLFTYLLTTADDQNVYFMNQYGSEVCGAPSPLNGFYVSLKYHVCMSSEDYTEDYTMFATECEL